MQFLFSRPLLAQELVTSCSLIWIRFQHATCAYLSKGVIKSQLRSADLTGRHKAVAFGFVSVNSTGSTPVSSAVCDWFLVRKERKDRPANTQHLPHTPCYRPFLGYKQEINTGGKYQEKRTQCCQWPVGMKGLSQRDAAERNKSPTKEGMKTS